MSDKKVITLYLAEWQKRMIVDYIPDLKAIHELRIIVADEKKTILLYKEILRMYIPKIEAINPKTWSLYLTDEQINYLKEVTGGKVKFTVINVTPELLQSKAIEFV
jgi:hypothetical protein